jgi:hypothetical protein
MEELEVIPARATKTARLHSFINSALCAKCGRLQDPAALLPGQEFMAPAG